MKPMTQVKLQATPDQFKVLKKTLENANAACNYVSRVAWGKKTFNQFRLHHLVYGDIREQFGLTAQVAVRCISKVADAYKKDRKTRRSFKPRSAIAFDDRILHWFFDKSEVSIWTMDGRMRIQFICGDRQRTQLKFRKGESDLILFRDNFYLSATWEIDEPIPTSVGDVIGIDLGVADIAVTSDGRMFAGKTINNIRYRRAGCERNFKRKARVQPSGC